MFKKMTEKEAQDNVAAMLAETPRNARQFVWREAIKSDRLTEEAKEVYREALRKDGAKA